MRFFETKAIVSTVGTTVASTVIMIEMANAFFFIAAAVRRAFHYQPRNSLSISSPQVRLRRASSNA